VQPVIRRLLDSFVLRQTEDPPTRPARTDLEAAVEAAETYRASPAVQSALVDSGLLVARRLDDFMESMTPTYQTDEGPVRVQTPFFMAGPSTFHAQDVKKNAASVRAAAARAGLTEARTAEVQSGRGSPEDIRRITQALIDGGALKVDWSKNGKGSPDTTQSPRIRIREMMQMHGIGVDCAGYVQRAYLYATGASRGGAGFRPPIQEDLARLASLGFRQVRDVSDLRPGDIVSLGPPGPREVGHRAIVSEQRQATDDEVRAFIAEYRDFAAPFLGIRGPIGGRIEQAEAFADQLARSGALPHLRIVHVDSSWGSGGDARDGGVLREVWWYRAETEQWARSGNRIDHGRDSGTELNWSSRPYEHPLIGFFRGPGLVRQAEPPAAAAAP
jgi:hypothetical protein